MADGATHYIVTYDICDPKRLHHVFNAMRKYGEHLQLSVFECTLDDQQEVLLRTALRRIIHSSDDQVLFIRVGNAATTITAIGRPYAHKGHDVTVL